MNDYFGAVSSNFIEDGSYIRLSYVTLAYDFGSLLKKTPITGLKLSVTGRNLFCLPTTPETTRKLTSTQVPVVQAVWVLTTTTYPQHAALTLT